MIEVIRKEPVGNAVPGALYLNGAYICDTLENKAKLISIGLYEIEVCNSPAFTKKRGKSTNMPLIYNSANPASRGLRIHAGNKVSDSAGCILVGKLTDSKDSLKAGSLDWEMVITKICENQKSLIVV